jgi:hypothetical protein
MENGIAYEFLWQVIQKEKQANELQVLPKTFYQDVAVFLKNFDKKDLGDEDATIKKNTLKMINDLYERRKQKILIYVAYKKPIPQPAIPQELEFYNKAVELASANRLDIDGQNGKNIIMRSLQAIPEIILPHSGKKVGPFEKDQMVEIGNDEEDIKFLINNTICQKQ